uniref:hypothetical protein n=1 Tax=Actinomadura physcomitrii TaxID=2650748 RepID=UPI001F42E0F5|nr:hypothetical protein [Actinomadura physcomitrii]
MAHLPERPAAGGPDDAQRVEGLLRAGLGDVDGDARLDGDEAHAVRDDVVELAGDTEPFLADGGLGEAAGGPGGVGAAVADGAAERPGRAEDGDAEDRAAALFGLPVLRPDQRAAEDGDRAQHADRPGGDEARAGQFQRERVERVAGGGVEVPGQSEDQSQGGRGEDGAEDRDGPDPPDGERQSHGGGDGHGEERRGVAAAGEHQQEQRVEDRDRGVQAIGRLPRAGWACGEAGSDSCTSRR